MNLNSYIKLNNGLQMPIFGLGVWRSKDGKEVIDAVTYAVQAGYKMIDTAMIYENEVGVGQGIKDSGIKRDDIFVTTKLWNSDQGYDKTLFAYEQSLKRLNLDFVDLYLIHWPKPELTKDTWRAMERIYDEKRVKAIGVCNFHQNHLEELLSSANIAPVINQIELHPNLTQIPLRQMCAKYDIKVQAWSPLGQGKLLDNEVLEQIAKKYSKTVAQIILRWDIQNEIITIPKSVNKDRIVSNANIFDFELSEQDIKKIDSLNINKRFGPDPDNFDF